MNAIVNTDCDRRESAKSETSAIASETTKTTNRLEGATTFTSAQALSRYYRWIRQEFVWVLASLYFAGAAALVGAILYAHLSSKSPLPILPETARCLQVPQM